MKITPARRRLWTYFVPTAVIYFMTYFLVYKNSLMESGSDVATHMKHALSLDLVLELTHNGWHFACWLIYALLPADINTAAAISTALFNALAAVLVVRIVLDYHKPDFSVPGSTIVPVLVSMAALLAGPLYLRFYNPEYYLGQTSPNAWHSPTTIAVRPFMLLITLLTLRYYDLPAEKRTRLFGREWHTAALYQILMAVLLAAATAIKPSFLMLYLPACFVIALIRLFKSRGRDFFALLLAHLYMLPALLVLGRQYVSIFLRSGEAAAQNGGKAAGVGIALFKSAKVYAPSPLFSVLLLMAFPLLVTIFWWKQLLKDKLYLFSGLEFIMGLLISWTLTETGKREKSGNFGWCKILGASMLWIVCLAFYSVRLKEDKDQLLIRAGLAAKHLLTSLTLLWHLIAGICYFIYVLHNPGSQL